MAQHQTTVPEQAQTETMLVFDTAHIPNKELLGRVEVPTHTTPDEDGEKLSKTEKQMVAVKRVVESENTIITGPGDECYEPSEVAFSRFTVLSEIDGEFDRIMYQPDLASSIGVEEIWNPEQE